MNANIILKIYALIIIFTFNACRQWDNPYDELIEKEDVTEETGTVTDYDGNTYPVVIIGNQMWMAEDLRVTHYPDGTAIPHVTDSTAWSNLNIDDKAYCFYNNNSETDYGALYTWAAAMGDNAASSSTNPSGVQGICPNGWHLPSDAEWTELTDYLGGEAVAGGELKESDTIHWNSPNEGATNSSGFSALPEGIRHVSDIRTNSFYGIGIYNSFWSTNTPGGPQYGLPTALAFGTSCNTNNVEIRNLTCISGVAVRCVKN